MRRYLMAAVACVLWGCAVPGLSDDHVGELLSDPQVRQFLPMAVPDGFTLATVKPFTGEEGAIEGAAAYFQDGEGDNLVMVCGTRDEALLDLECSEPRPLRESIERDGAPMVVQFECVSKSCDNFDLARWSSLFGAASPGPEALPRVPSAA